MHQPTLSAPHTTEWLPTACIDFDGVIHSYERGWQGGHLYGTVVPGFFEWADSCHGKLALVVYSTRSGDAYSGAAMHDWLRQHFNEWKARHPKSALLWSDFDFRRSKPPAIVYIDDRGVRFNGKWDSPELTPEALVNFTPWNWPNGRPQK